MILINVRNTMFGSKVTEILIGGLKMDGFCIVEKIHQDGLLPTWTPCLVLVNFFSSFNFCMKARGSPEIHKGAILENMRSLLLVILQDMSAKN